MGEANARLSDALVAGIDESAKRLDRSRAEVIRLAVEHLPDPGDPVLDWSDVRARLLAAD